MKYKQIYIMGLVFLFIPFLVFAMTIKEQIRTGYRDILNREPTGSEVRREKVTFRNFDKLKKELNSLPERNVAIINIYQRALKRKPRTDELEALKRFVAPNNLIRTQLYESRERELAIRDLYSGLLGRQPREDSLVFYVRTRSPFTKIKVVLNESQERLDVISKVYKKRRGSIPSETEMDTFITGLVYLDRIGSVLPIANAGKDAVLYADNLKMTLDASKSLSSDGDGLLYAWTLLSSPKDGYSFVDSTSDSLFTFDVLRSDILSKYAMEGDYRWMLQVSDKNGTSKSDEVLVHVNYYSKPEEELLTLVNNMRQKKNIDPMVFNPKLVWASRKYADYMLKNDWFAHKNKEGKIFVDRVVAEGYDYLLVGENLGVIKSNLNDLTVGGKTEATFFADFWKNSPAHYKNIMTDEFKETGLGFALGQTNDTKFPYKLFVVQEFGDSLK